MRFFLIYIKMEVKRAIRYLPFLLLGIALLGILLGGGFFLGSRMLYGDEVSGRIQVAVVLPEDDPLAGKAMRMVESLESVKSLCDFQEMSREDAEAELKKGSIYAALLIPDGFVQDIMNGTNTPVTVVFPGQSRTENLIFEQLTSAGARILGAAQAGIYSGDEYLIENGRENEISTLEEEMNRLYLSANLSRKDYFKRIQISGTGDVSVAGFYAASSCVLILLFSILSVSEYLIPWNQGMRECLDAAGIGPWKRVVARVIGLGVLFFVVTICGAMIAVWKNWTWISVDSPLNFFRVTAWLFLTDVSIAAFGNGIFQQGEGLAGGILWLFVVTMTTHFLAGGFLPTVFLPEKLRAISVWMPTKVFMNAFQAFAADYLTIRGMLELAAVLILGFALSLMKEVQNQ